MAEIVNLRRARKAKARRELDKVADANRVQHGTPKHLRAIAKTEAGKAAREHALRKLRSDDKD